MIDLPRDLPVVKRSAVRVLLFHTHDPDHPRLENHVGFRRWPVVEVAASGERFHPGRLPRLLTPFLAGYEIDELFS